MPPEHRLDRLNLPSERFEIKDFLVKLGSVTVGGVFKGILVEVEYCPGVVPNNCWGILLEFMQVSLSLEKKDFNLSLF